MEYLVAYLIVGTLFALVGNSLDKDFRTPEIALSVTLWPLILVMAIRGSKPRGSSRG